MAQSYLPLANIPIDNANTHKPACSDGPVMATLRDPALRAATQPFPGMILKVIETTYSPTRDDASPVVTEWQWTIPVAPDTKVCVRDDASVPTWTREDLLKVRRLLAGAQHPQTGSSNTEYFAEAMAAACPDATLVPRCYEAAFLDRFVAGLSLNIRGQADRPSQPGNVDSTGFDPAPPVAVLASESSGEIGEHTGLGRWYRGLMRPRPADLFSSGHQAAECARAFRESSTPSTQDAEVCQFALASLEWRDEAGLPGQTLSKLTKLWLLRSGDPLLLMQPTAYRAPLDISTASPCAGDPACPIDKRMAQGFADIDLLLPITIDGGAREWVPVGLSIGDFERRRGVKIKAVQRSLDWLPAELSVDGRRVAAAKLKSGKRRVTLRFAERKSGNGVTVASADASRPARDDFLFAPGDILILAEAR